jgi:hypothetical protein
MRSKIILVQNKLKSLGLGFDSIFADGANDIIVKSPSTNKELKIKVLARSGPKPAGGTGADALDWWIPENIAVDAVAFVDLDKERCWLFKKSDIPRYAQQHPPGKYHFFMYIDRDVNIHKDRLCFDHEFDEFLIENNFKSVLG